MSDDHGRRYAVDGGGGWQMASRLKNLWRTGASRPLSCATQLMRVFHETSVACGSGTFCTYWGSTLKASFTEREVQSPGNPRCGWCYQLSVSSLVVVLLSLIGSWNMTDLVPKPIECCRRISASLSLLSTGVMKIASKQGNICKKKSSINQKMRYPA